MSRVEEGALIDEGEDLALITLTSSLAFTSPPLVDKIRVTDLPVFLKELNIARRLATLSHIFTSDSEKMRVCEELTNSHPSSMNDHSKPDQLRNIDYNLQQNPLSLSLG